MISRLGWTGCDPSAMWKLWDVFDLKEAKIIGYWDTGNPVQPDSAYASWTENNTRITLHVDWN
jgi:hypothetical protein